MKILEISFLRVVNVIICLKLIEIASEKHSKASNIHLPGLTPYYYPECKNGGNRIFDGGTTRCNCTFNDKQRGSLCETLRVNLDNANDMIEVRLLDQIDENMFNIDDVLRGVQKFHMQFSFVSADFESSGQLLTLSSKENSGEKANIRFVITGNGLQVTLEIGKETYSIGPFKNSLTDNKWHKIDFFINYDITDGYLKGVLVIDRCSHTKGKCQDSVNLWRRFITIGNDLNIGANLHRKGINQLCLENLIIQDQIIDFWPSTEILDLRRNCPSCESFCKDGVCGKFGECRNVWSNSSLFTCKCQDGYIPNEIVEPKNSLPVYENAMIARQPCNMESQSYMTKQGVFRWKSNRGIPISIALRFRHFGSNLNLLTIGSWKYSLTISKNNITILLGTEQAVMPNLNLLDGNWHHIKITISQTNKINGIQSDYVYTETVVDHLYGEFYKSLLVKGDFLQDYPEIRLAFSQKQTCLDDFWIEYPDQEEFNQQFYPLKTLTMSEIDKFFVKGCQSDDHCHKFEQKTDIISACPDPDRVCSPVWGGYECRCTNGLFPLRQGLNNEEFCVPLECLPNPCLNEGICQKARNISFILANSTRNYECTCPAWSSGMNCEIVFKPSNVLNHRIEWPWWAILLLLLLGLLLLLLLFLCGWLLCGKWKRRREKKKILEKTAVEVEKYDKGNCYSLESAGERDYRGPIDYNLLSKIKSNHAATQSNENNPISPIVINQYPTYLIGPRIEEDQEIDLSNTDPDWMRKVTNMYSTKQIMDSTLNYAFEGDYPNLSRTNSNISQMNITYIRSDSPVTLKKFNF